MKKCEEEFTDIDKLKKALEICEINIASGKKSHGIKALRLAYKYGEIKPNNKTNGKGKSKGASSDVNDNFRKYGDKLESMLQESQEGKFKNTQKFEFKPNFEI